MAEVQTRAAADDAGIVLDGVEKTFDAMDRPAVDTLSARIVAGRITGLVGPDGAGKTTLMRMIAGLLLPTRGTIAVAGRSPTDDIDALRTDLGYMPQKFGLYEDLSVLENLELYADLRAVLGAERTSTFERLLAFTDLARFSDRLAGKLSGGMKQKLGLACALLGKPRVLLLDEPSVGVDPISRRELWKMVGELAGEGMTVVWSTAYLDEAEACADVLLMHEGRLLHAGTPQSLTQPLEGRAVHVTGIAGHRREVLRRALALPEVLDGVIQGRNVRLVLRDAARAPARDALEAGPDARIAPVAPRFEDAFIDLLSQTVDGGKITDGRSSLADAIRDDGGIAVPPRQAGNDVAIEVSHLTKRFGDFAATDDVSFKVARGEIYGLLGPNGAGKSTTFKMLCGLLKPTSGDATVAGISLLRSASQARQRLGYMAQKFSLYGSLTVAQNLRFFSGVYGLSGREQSSVIDRMVSAFELAPYLGVSPDTLPLGFKQRLALACAVMHRPEILFLDEPTSGVDPITRREFWTHINGMVALGVTVMVTTHFMDEAEYCDRIGLVYRGKLIASGTPDALKESAAGAGNGDPSMEDAFIALVERADRERQAGARKPVQDEVAVHA